MTNLSLIWYKNYLLLAHIFTGVVNRYPNSSNPDIRRQTQKNHTISKTLTFLIPRGLLDTQVQSFVGGYEPTWSNGRIRLKTKYQSIKPQVSRCKWVNNTSSWSWEWVCVCVWHTRLIQSRRLTLAEWVYIWCYYTSQLRFLWS